jgi:hypothetical protein
MKRFIDIAVILSAVSFGISYAIFFRKALSVQYWGILISLTLATGAVLMALVSHHLKAGRDVKIKLGDVRLLMSLFLIMAAAVFGYIEGLL